MAPECPGFRVAATSLIEPSVIGSGQTVTPRGRFVPLTTVATGFGSTFARLLWLVNQLVSAFRGTAGGTMRTGKALPFTSLPRSPADSWTPDSILAASHLDPSVNMVGGRGGDLGRNLGLAAARFSI